MILQSNCGKPHNYFVKFKDNVLENAKEYEYLSSMININKGNNKITELRTILQRESQNS